MNINTLHTRIFNRVSLVGKWNFKYLIEKKKVIMVTASSALSVAIAVPFSYRNLASNRFSKILKTIPIETEMVKKMSLDSDVRICIPNMLEKPTRGMIKLNIFKVKMAGSYSVSEKRKTTSDETANNPNDIGMQIVPTNKSALFISSIASFLFSLFNSEEIFGNNTLANVLTNKRGILAILMAVE